jgi:hypothetical protein
LADRGVNRRAIVVLLAAALIGAGLFFGLRYAADRIVRGPDPVTIAEASLQGLREQNRLSALVANYVAVVTTTQHRFGLEAQKTLIMPGLVRYEVDLGKLDAKDVRWDASARELKVVLPPLEVAGPQVDLTHVKEYDAGGLLIRLTDAATTLDAANRAAGQAELLRQAREPVPIALAKDATRRAIERSFALPLRAAGLDATVRVRFPDEPNFPGADHEQMDRSRSIAEVYRDGAGVAAPSKR